MAKEDGDAKRVTLSAFILLVVLVGTNLVAIRFSNRELAPFWGASVRFAIAAAIFWAMVAATRAELPRGRTLVGALLYGLLGFAAFFGFMYLGLVDVPVSLATSVLALAPLLTLFLAVAHGMERFSWRALAGGLIAAAGIAIAYGGIVGGDVPVLSLLAIVGATLCMAEAGIAVKRLPPGDPVAANAIGTTVGALVLLPLSAIVGEPWIVPRALETWVATAYLVTLGTLAVFLLLLYVLKRWRASAVAYQFVLAPFVAVALGAILLGEQLTLTYAIGAALALAGVYVGALARPLSRPRG